MQTITIIQAVELWYKFLGSRNVRRDKVHSFGHYAHYVLTLYNGQVPVFSLRLEDSGSMICGEKRFDIAPKQKEEMIDAFHQNIFKAETINDINKLL